MSSLLRNSRVFGSWPIATKTPSAARVVRAPVFTFSSTTALTPVSGVPSMSAIALSQTKVIFGLARARSCMIFEARKWSRRCTTVTLVAKRVRKIASSIAVSPPPTITSSLPLKKKPSQVAQADTPWPMSRVSAGIPSSFAEAPVATTSVSVESVEPSASESRNGRRARSASVTSAARKRVPKRSAWRRNRSTISGPMTPSGKPGKFSTSVVIVSCPPGCMPSTTRGERLARAA